MNDIKKTTAREVVAHIMDLEGRAHRLATENADLREQIFPLELDLSQTTVECLALGQRVERLKAENAAMLNALAKAAKALTLAVEVAPQTLLTPYGVSILTDGLEAVSAFVGNIETETLTDEK